MSQPVQLVQASSNSNPWTVRARTLEANGSNTSVPSLLLCFINLIAALIYCPGILGKGKESEKIKVQHSLNCWQVVTKDIPKISAEIAKTFGQRFVPFACWICIYLHQLALTIGVKQIVRACALEERGANHLGTLERARTPTHVSPSVMRGPCMQL